MRSQQNTHTSAGWFPHPVGDTCESFTSTDGLKDSVGEADAREASVRLYDVSARSAKPSQLWGLASDGSPADCRPQPGWNPEQCSGCTPARLLAGACLQNVGVL